MRRNYLIIAILVILPAIIAAVYFGFFAGPKGDYVARITNFNGQVVVLKVNDLRARPAYIDQGIEIGDILRTQKDSKAEITFTDGTVVGVAENTKINVMDYLVEGSERKKGLIRLSRGKIRAIVTKASKGKRPGQFNVVTPTAVTGVRGTDFFLIHDKGYTKLAVKEGSVDIYNPTKCDQIVEGELYRQDCGNVVVEAGLSTKVLAQFTPEPPKQVSEREMIILTEETTIASVAPVTDPNLEPVSFSEEGVQSSIRTASIPKELPPIYKMPERVTPLKTISARDVGRITTGDLMARLREGKDVLIFDVRDKETYQGSLTKIKGSVRVPLGHMARVAKRLPPGRMIVTYCSKPNEGLSSKAAAILMNNGYESVLVLEGGLYAWEYYHYPLEVK
ncbi:MAG: FecR domain-containing protein [Thermodesulfobacteriota bacterium]